MRAPQIARLREDQPDLLAWERLRVKVIKDRAQALSTVSELGTAHGGLERDSSVWRIGDGARAFIVKHHAEAAFFHREAANITFVNEAGGFGPELVWADPSSGILLMEDLGDRSLAWVWQQGDMAQYERWTAEVVDVVLAVEAHFDRHEERLRALYGDLNPDSPPRTFPPEETVTQLDEALRISRGAGLSDADRNALRRIAEPMSRRLEAFCRRHRTFCLGLGPQHVIRKDGRLRVIDLTFPPVGSVLGQLGNLTWHLDDERDIHRRYLTGRVRLRLPPLDHEEFLLLTDWLGFLRCVLWIRIYCRDILEGEQALVDLAGRRLTDYEANETANLKALYRALAPYPQLSAVVDILNRGFGRPAVRT